MKYVILVGDGMADYPLLEKGEKTALQISDTPNMDFIAYEGMQGVVKTIPEGMNAGSDIAILSILGYNPERYYTGRGPLEAIGMNVSMSKEDVAFRCNLITEKEGKMEDYSGGHIESDEAKELIKALNEELSTEKVRFYAGIGYRNLFLVNAYKFEKEKEIGCAPPHEIIDALIEEKLPKEKILREVILGSRKVLEKYKKKANMVWLWSGGRLPEMPKFEDIYGVKSSVISAVHLIKGVGRCAGLEVIDVPGATGFIDTNYEGKAKYALKSLKRKDFVLIHVEAPDEASHIGDIEMKVKTIEDFDKKVVGTILNGLGEKFKEEGYNVLVLPDHYTPVLLRSHTKEAVPFAIYFANAHQSEGSKGRMKKEKRKVGFDEMSALKGKNDLNVLPAGYLMPLFLDKLPYSNK